jgi:hypothetical protein
MKDLPALNGSLVNGNAWRLEKWVSGNRRGGRRTRREAVPLV